MKHYNQEHYNYFKQHLSFNESWAGNNIKNWWNDVTDDSPCNLPSAKLARKGLKALCKDSTYSDEECLGAIMAWGGQNRMHGKTLFSRKDEILPIVAEMRSSSIDHLGAYKAFDDIWQKKQALGMGAAYFTKLIFFCEPRHQGFIMDQWTSKSTNMLCDENIIDLTNDGFVTKNNDSNTYNKFCNAVQGIATNLNTSAERIEMAMFSQGRHTPAAWRQYVVKNWGN